MNVRQLGLVSSAVVVACGSLNAERPAVIAASTAGARAEITRAVTLALDGARVTLADDAFTLDSVLTVERRTPTGPEGRAATGRTLEQPVRLRLVLDGVRCALVRDSDGQRFVLNGVQCVPLHPER